MTTEEVETRVLLLWASRQLNEHGIVINDFNDFKSGVSMIHLLEVLFAKIVPFKACRVEPTREIEMVLNFECALEFVTRKGLRIVGLSGRDLYDGKGLLAFLSQLYFKSSAMLFHSQDTDDPLLAWVNQVLKPQRVIVSNWYSQWNDGVVIYSLLALLRPDVLSLDDVFNFSPYERAEKVITRNGSESRS
jgi:hypothetical protein